MKTDLYYATEAVGYVDGCYRVYYFASDGKGTLIKNQTVNIDGVIYQADNDGISKIISPKDPNYDSGEM